MSTDLSQNYFEIFGLPVSFEIDSQRLSECYRDLQRAVHPDKFANATDRERRLAVQQAALINEAFNILKTPLNRARYLLKLKGVDFDDERETTFDPEFLMEQMELRETLDAIRDKADPLTSLGQLMKEIEKRLQLMTEQLSSLITADDLQAAKTQLHKMQFLAKLKSESEALEEDLIDAI